MPENKTLNYDKALELLERAVDEKGVDYVYDPPRFPETTVAGVLTTMSQPECAYFDPDGQPSCIVGYVLSYLGIDADTVNRAGANIGFNPEGLFDHLRAHGDIDYGLDHDANVLLRLAQTEQDGGQPWGAAVLNARTVVSQLSSVAA